MSATKGLTQAQKEIVKACVPILAEHGKTVTSLFYKNMLNSHTELKNVFNNTHQVTGHQAQSLACSVFAYAKYIDNLEVLGEAVERICQKHASIYIRPDQYAIVGGNLLAAFKEILGEAFTPEIHDAWEAAYWQLANIMIEREKQLYAENDGWTDWRDFVLDKKVKESEEITSFYWKPKDGKPLPLYKPGQYISVQTKVPQFEYLQSRQYSLSGVPSTEYYRNSIKRETGQSSGCPYAKTNPGWISNWLHDHLQVGDTIQMSHPQGEFFMDTKKTSPVVLISGGVGITPMMSMLETLHAEKSNRKVCWMHTTRSSGVQAFGKHVNELCKSLPNAHSVVFNLDPKDAEYTHKGKLDLEKVNKEKDLFLGDKTTEYYVCGPEGFMVDVAQKLQSYGVDKSQIKAELFSTGGVPV